MRTNGIRWTSVSAVLALVGVAVGAVAVGVSVSASQSTIAPDIGDARVSLGTQSARVIEQVSYRDGVERIADVVIKNGSPVGEIDDPDVAAAWKIVDSVWPASLRAELKQVSVIDEGPRGLVGVVHRSSTGGWILSVDRVDLPDRRLVQETIIHEIAHVVTLGPDVFSFDTEAGCNGVTITVGCAFSGSLMARYAERFWPGGAVDAPPSALADVYAASAPHEDLAETFTAWVAGWPVVSADVASRIEMLSADPEIAPLAAEIRDGMG